MSIATELTLLANSKQAIKNSINQKGGSITDSTPFADYSTAIDNLPSGGGNKLLTSIDVSDFSDYQFDAKKYITGATIPNGVTNIASECFSGFGSLTNVVLPNNLLVINGSAFSGCRSITSLVIPDSVTSFGSSAFLACENLTSINIPSGITTIGNSLFRNCTRLQKLDLPSGITTIGPSAFQNCSSLTYVVVRATTPPTLSSGVFNNTNDCPIYVPAESVDAYRSASGWSTYASRIYGIEQVATVDNTPVYNYELGNTDSTTILSTEILKMPTGTSIEFAEGITNMGGEITGYTTVTLPSTFATFNDQNMIGSSVTTLTMKSTTPPTAERNNFGGAGLTAIYVPASAVDTYKAASGWSNFASIIQAIPSPTPSVTSITFSYNDGTSPGDWGELKGCSETVNVDSFEAASANSTFDSDIKAADSVAVEDNLGNDVTSQCTFSSNDYYKWDSTQDPSYDGESEASYEWRLDTYIGDADAQNPQSATITATYGNLSDTFTIEWTTTSNCSEPEPEPEPDPEEPEE